MPRRNRAEDLDFEIHVDPSCLSDPMDDNEQKGHEEPKVDVQPDHDQQQDTQTDTEQKLDSPPEEAKAEPEVEAPKEDDTPIAAPEEPEEAKEASNPEPEPEAKDDDTQDKPEEPAEELQEEAEASVPEPSLDDTQEKEVETAAPAEEPKEDEPAEEDKAIPAESEGDELAAAEDSKDEPTEEDKAAVAESEGEETVTVEIPKNEPIEETAVPAEDSNEGPKKEDPTEEDKVKVAESEGEEATAADDLEEDTHHSETESDASESRRNSSASSGSYESDRRHSGRTEALIQKAARDIVEQIGNHERESLNSYSGSDETGYFSHSEPASARQSDAHMSVAGRSHASYEDGARSGVDEADANSSHHEHEDDVFSDRSPRSSMGSVSETDQRKAQEAMSRMNRVSGISGISGISEYERDEEDDFVPTIRGNPRPAFRSPSSVKAMQMSSPPGSTIGSPRSSRRAPLPTVSRIGSPRFSEQYSPKKTPPRFKRATPPLVLLHVTLLPLRWPWGDVLENAEVDDLSQECKTIRDAWRQLQDRMGDTTVERGILLPHPQNDYEILEERLLEALELPMRRRARILECGHYLGPSNEMTIEDSSSEEEDSDYEDMDTRRSSRRSQVQKTHWCKTCRTDIRYESLGPGKIFRVKVYASNGLIRGGAWEACWKEMERVDVEIEPLVDAVAQQELVQLEADQERELAMREAEEDERYARLEEEHREFEERERGRLSRRRGESRSLVEDETDESDEDETHLDEGVTNLGEGESHIGERSLRAESHREVSHHDLSLRDIVPDDHDKSRHSDHNESHIPDVTEPLDEHVADTTREAADEPAEEPAADIIKDYTQDHIDLDKSRSFEELEKDIDEYLKEEQERSQAEEGRPSLEPQAEPDVSQMENLEAEARAAPSVRAPSTRAPSISAETPLKPSEEEQKRQDEERLREIYGDVPPAHEEHREPEQPSFSEYQQQHHDQQYTDRTHPSPTPHPSTYSHASPPSPSAEAFARREERRQAMKNASLPELVSESARVMLQDKKNVLIGLLSILILLLAVRGGPAPQDPRTFQTVVRNVQVPTVTVTQGMLAETAEAMRQVAASVEAVVEEESSVAAEMPKESVVAEQAPSVERCQVAQERPVAPEESVIVQERAAPEEIVAPQENAEIVEDEQVVDSGLEAADSSSAPPHNCNTSMASSSTNSVDPCASCTISSRGARDAVNQKPQASEAAHEHVHAPQPPRRETETIVSERIVRVVETVTEVETATVKVTETATEVVLSQETQPVEAAVEEEQPEGSVAPAVEEEKQVDDAEAPVDDVEASVDEVEVPTEEAAPPAEETVLAGEEVAASVEEEQEPTQETVAPVEEPLDEVTSETDVESSIEADASLESVAPEASEDDAEEASEPAAEQSEEADHEEL